MGGVGEANKLLVKLKPEPTNFDLDLLENFVGRWSVVTGALRGSLVLKGRQEPQNCRPMSLTSHLTKCFERLIRERSLSSNGNNDKLQRTFTAKIQETKGLDYWEGLDKLKLN